MTKELLVLGLYFFFFPFLRCYIVKQNWIGLLWHKINLQSNSHHYLTITRRDSHPSPRPHPAGSVCRAPAAPLGARATRERSVPAQGHVCRKQDGKRRGNAEHHRSPASLLHSTGDRADRCHEEPPLADGCVSSHRQTFLAALVPQSDNPPVHVYAGPENLPRGAHSSPAAMPAAPTGTKGHR